MPPSPFRDPVFKRRGLEMWCIWQPFWIIYLLSQRNWYAILFSSRANKWTCTYTLVGLEQTFCIIHSFKLNHYKTTFVSSLYYLNTFVGIRIINLFCIFFCVKNNQCNINIVSLTSKIFPIQENFNAAKTFENIFFLVCLFFHI